MNKTHDIRYRYILLGSDLPDGTRALYNVGIFADGTLYNPRGYPEDIVRAAVLAANQRRAQRRSQSAKKAAITRAAGREKKIYEVVEKLQLGHKYGPASHCVVCGKGLGDPESIERGIGSDCWQVILRKLDAEQQMTTAKMLKE
jgi:hypothetical protein